MSPAADDDEPRGYGARRGWRAPKGSGRAQRRARDRKAREPRPAAPRDADRGTPGSIAPAVARLLDLDADDAARIRAEELPAPGAPDAIPAALRAAGRLIADARREARDARDDAETAARRRERDAQRAQSQVARAQDRAARQHGKATAEQGERQRLAGELERAQARLSEAVAERDHLRDRHARARDHDDGGRDDRHEARLAGLAARVEELEDQLRQRTAVLEQLSAAHEAAAAENARLLASARRLRRLAVEAGAATVDLVDPEDAAPLDAAQLPRVRTVLGAVELAAAHAQHLIYTDRAFSTARTAPYDEPRKLLRDLVALDRVAAAWDVAGGIGRPIRDVAVEQQLDWADDVSDAARGQNAREYLFVHQGRTLWAGPHVRVATGRGLQRTCRVYLALVKGTEPDLAGLPRGIYVGPVGRHLSDSTSG